MRIREMSLSARTKSCLLSAGYNDIEDLKNATYSEVSTIRNLNQKCLDEILKELKVLGVSLKDYSKTISADQCVHNLNKDHDTNTTDDYEINEELPLLEVDGHNIEGDSWQESEEYSPRALKTIREWLDEYSFELPIVLKRCNDFDTKYVLQTIRNNYVYAEVYKNYESVDYCRFSIEETGLFSSETLEERE